MPNLKEIIQNYTRVRTMSEEKKIFRRSENLKDHYYPKHRILPYKSPVVAWTSEEIWMKDHDNNTVKGIKLQPLQKRFRINNFTGELIGKKK